MYLTVASELEKLRSMLSRDSSDDGSAASRAAGSSSRGYIAGRSRSGGGSMISNNRSFGGQPAVRVFY